MRSRLCLASVVFAVLIVFAFNPSVAKESRKLAAPVYPGAVPAVPADGLNVNPVFILTFDGGKALDCAGTTVARDIAGREISPDQAGPASEYTGPWCFLTRDPIDKVKAFYEKSVGKMQAVRAEDGMHGYEAFTERAWIEGNESMPGYGYAGVSVHELAPPPVKGKASAAPAMGDDQWAGQDEYGFYTQTRFFGGFMDGVDLFGDPTKRPLSDLDALYKKKNYLESALFQHKGPDFERVDETLVRQYDELRGQRQQAAMMGTMTALQQQGASAQSAGPTAEEDAKFNKVMASDPALQQRYVALTQQVQTLTMQGKLDEADKVMDEIDELEAAHPELAAMNAQQQARSDKISARNKASENAISSRGNSQMDQAIWGTGLEMLDALDKQAYYTLIVIDNGYDESQKGFSRDRAAIDADMTGMMPHDRIDAWGIKYSETAHILTAGGAGGQEAAPEEKKDKESMKDKAKKKLSKLFGH